MTVIELYLLKDCRAGDLKSVCMQSGAIRVAPGLIFCLRTEPLGETCVFQFFVFPSIKKKIKGRVPAGSCQVEKGKVSLYGAPT